MNWINIYTPEVRSPVFIGCDPIARATWFSVLIYCSEQENGGRLQGAKTWKDRQWQQMCGVTLEEVNHSAPLLVWDGDDLLIWNYPLRSEEKVRFNRGIGSQGGKSRSDAKLAACRANGFKPRNKASSEALHEPEHDAQHEAERVAAHEACNEAQREASNEALHEGKDKDKDKDKDKGKGKEADPVFDAFWSAYPRKVAKGAARRAFDKLTDKDAAVTASAAYAAAVALWSDEDKQFVPHPATWLNDGRFEDDPSTWARNSKAAPREMYGNDYFKRRDEIEAQKERDYQARLAREKAAHEAALAGAAEVCADLLADDPNE
jgi:hypothetical protein